MKSFSGFFLQRFALLRRHNLTRRWLHYCIPLFEYTHAVVNIYIESWRSIAAAFSNVDLLCILSEHIDTSTATWQISSVSIDGQRWHSFSGKVYMRANSHWSLCCSSMLVPSYSSLSYTLCKTFWSFPPIILAFSRSCKCRLMLKNLRRDFFFLVCHSARSATQNPHFA